MHKIEAKISKQILVMTFELKATFRLDLFVATKVKVK